MGSNNRIEVFGKASDTLPCKFREMPALPSSWLLVGPSGCGKTMILINLLLKFYAGAWDRVYFFSPSIFLDPQYLPLRKMLEKQCPDQEKEPNMFETLDQAVLMRICDTQRSICEACRKKGWKLPEICIVLDDFGDDGRALTARKGGLDGSFLTTLAVRGRHFHASFICTVQCLNLAGTIIRKNVRNLCVWTLRNHKEIECLCHELSGYYDAKTIMELYKYAIDDQPYSFLWCKLDAKMRRDVFWLRFEARLLPENSSDSDKDDVGRGEYPGRKDDLSSARGPQTGRKDSAAEHRLSKK